MESMYTKIKGKNLIEMHRYQNVMGKNDRPVT